MNLVVYTLDGDRIPVEDVDDVYVTNSESFKDPADLKHRRPGEKVLLVNANAFTAVVVDVS